MWSGFTQDCMNCFCLRFQCQRQNLMNSIQDDDYVGPPVDIWALGILLYFITTGSMPFKASTVASLKHAIIDGRFATPDYLSEPCTSLILKILRRKPEDRLNMKQVCADFRMSVWWIFGGFLAKPKIGN